MTPDDVEHGVIRFVTGLAKKLLIADPLGQIADLIFGLAPAELTAGAAWLGVICYALQIYFDFSGYSDMADRARAPVRFPLSREFQLSLRGRRRSRTSGGAGT